jgi:amino acid adenylation domain-containing protein
MTEPYEPIHLMVRRAAKRYPDRPAIEQEDGSLTYRELLARVDGLGAALLAAGAGPGALVAVLADRPADVITSLLAVLETGGAFVPLDPEFPAVTFPAVLGEVQPRWWLVAPGLMDTAERLRAGHGLAAELIPIARPPRQAEADAAPAAPAADIAVEIDPDALCYVYFTSGSTGRPKGIAGRLKAIDHFVRWEIETFGVGEGTRVSQLTSPAFDAFLRDAFVPLAAGGTICVPPSRETVLDGARLADWIDRQGVNLMHCTPSVFRSLLASVPGAERFPSLKRILMAGEPLLPADVRRWRAVFGDRIELVNFYGPSETTMIKLFHRVRPEDAEAKTIPVGQPMPGCRALVVDDKGQPCPPGRIGEIYIRTPYRSLGYLNQPERTAEVFIRNPWSDRADDIVYKTGDLGRLREDGGFEVIGRRDHQVKIRGIRVELAPIEERLREHAAVAEAVVADRTDIQGNKFLCAYVALRTEIETGRLAEHLRATLPEAMIPSAWVILEALPRTLSGKVDRKALPDPGQGGGKGRDYTTPRTPVEEEICALFAELLGLPRTGIHDSFFEMGGHSLLATLLLSRLRARFGVEVALRQIFRSPTVAELAPIVTQLQMAQEDEAEMAALLREVGGLSDEAADEMLEAETRADVR